MRTDDLAARLDHLAAHNYVITTRDIVNATGRQRRTVLNWLANGAPIWVWPAVLSYRGIFVIDEEYWRIRSDTHEVITPDRDIRRLSEIRGIKYIIGAKNSYRALSERQSTEIANLKADIARLRATRTERPTAANDSKYQQLR